MAYALHGAVWTKQQRVLVLYQGKMARDLAYLCGTEEYYLLHHSAESVEYKEAPGQFIISNKLLSLQLQE